jgi:AbiV family abortive infection protein
MQPEETLNRLSEDAQLLLNANRIASALALAVLSIEETGKASILRGLGMASSEGELKDHWKNYRSHKSKNVLWATFDYLKKGARKLEDFAPLFDPSEKHGQILDELKQLAFYTDCPKRGKWNEPDGIIDKELAASIVAISNAFVGTEPTSNEELEIYYRHMIPALKKDVKTIQDAYLNAYSEMQKKGIKPNGADEAKALIEGTILPLDAKL